jgi:hypothetical protein
MDIVSRALALPIPLPKEYVQSLPRIPKDKKFPKHVCRDVKVGEESTGQIIPLIILLVLCCLCCVSMISVGFGGYRWWKSSKYRPQTKIHRRPRNA